MVTDNVRAALGEIALLEPNWDGYGAQAVSEQVINNALMFLGEVEKLNVSTSELKVSPINNGVVAFSWERDEVEGYLEIGNARFSGYIKHKKGGLTFMDGELGKG